MRKQLKSIIKAKLKTLKAQNEPFYANDEEEKRPNDSNIEVQDEQNDLGHPHGVTEYEEITNDSNIFNEEEQYDSSALPIPELNIATQEVGT